jgi:prepilin-type N-terminal cleavage/methylation domain-containing protein
MLKSPSSLLVSRANRAGGFTLVELLVVIGIIAILAGVALGPITNGIKKAQESGAMQTTRTIALAEFQFANDNNGSYPDGADGGVVGSALMTGGYISDPNIFFLTTDKLGTVKPTTVAAFAQANCSFDFMGVGANVGVGSTAPDQLPLVWSQGEAQTGVVPAVSTGTYFKPANGIFGKDGVAVCYHSNNAFFRAPAPATATTKPAPGEITFIDQSFDPGAITYVVRNGAKGP